MCGRYIFISSADDLKNEVFFDSIQGEWEARFNISPGMMIPAMIMHQGTKRVGLLKWGLIPYWAKDAKIANQLINARSESVFEKASFKDSILNKRCIIFANAYYEWVQDNGKKRIIVLKNKREKILFFAGIWSSWINANKNKVYTTSIITCAANENISSYHDRMPVILAKNDCDTWLYSKTERDKISSFLKSDKDVEIVKIIDSIGEELSDLII